MYYEKYPYHQKNSKIYILLTVLTPIKNTKLRSYTIIMRTNDKFYRVGF